LWSEKSCASLRHETSSAIPASYPAADFMKFNFAVFFTLIIAMHLSAAIIGTNIPAAPLTAERIAALPAAQQPAWKNYLERSARQMQADRDFLHAEMKAHGVTNSITPPAGTSDKVFTESHPAAWYGDAEARHLADMIVSFQTPAGGWSKNMDMTRHVRAPGEAFATDSNVKLLSTADNDQPLDANWHYVGTFDNGATIMQLHFLAKVAAASGTNSAPYRAAFLRGLDYVFAAQYPNGGWPQVWPLEGGYHDAITFNDDAMIHIIELLRDVAGGQNEFAFVPPETRAKAAAGFKRGIDCILAAQIVVDGKRTVWCQQHDELTLQPMSARNYEMPSATAGESGGIVLFLLQLPEADSNIVAAVRAAVVWFEKTKIMGQAFKSTGEEGRLLTPAPGNGPIWARYYELRSDRPIFGDRDKSIHDDVKEISKERRNGYAWFVDTPKRVLEHYPRWAEAHPN
jgi:PelA/Pel-15E family pectate lyase